MNTAVRQKNIASITPSIYAEDLGIEFISTKKKSDIAFLGQYFTPHSVAELIAKNFTKIETKKTINILDPCAGSGILSCVLCERISSLKHPPKRIKLTVYEVDKPLITILYKSIDNLKDWLNSKDIKLEYEIHENDFVMENANILDQSLQQNIFGNKDFEMFDLIIANPPYFKIPKSDWRAKATGSVIHGQPNIYALFMATSAYLLKEKGQLGFITPRSYASGLYFKKFRQSFFDRVIPTAIHIFESRDKAFNKDRVLQENIILHATKDSTANHRKHKVKISSCYGISDINNTNTISIPLKEIISSENDYVLHIPTGVTQREILKTVRSWKNNLHSLGLEVSTGPIVPFRARDILAESPDEQNIPLIWLQNVKKMQVSWPLKLHKPQYVKTSSKAKKLLVPNKNYVLIRRFSSKEEKKRLVAAAWISKKIKSRVVGLENHLNYIYRKTGELTETQTLGLSAILNSSLLDSYFRIFNGNTQVSATELRNLPLPSVKVIEKIGSFVKSADIKHPNLDEKVDSLIKNNG